MKSYENLYAFHQIQYTIFGASFGGKSHSLLGFHYNYSLLDKQENRDKPKFNAATKIKLGASCRSQYGFHVVCCRKIICIFILFGLHILITTEY